MNQLEERQPYNSKSADSLDTVQNFTDTENTYSCCTSKSLWQTGSQKIGIHRRFYQGMVKDTPKVEEPPEGCWHDGQTENDYDYNS